MLGSSSAAPSLFALAAHLHQVALLWQLVGGVVCPRVAQSPPPHGTASQVLTVLHQLRPSAGGAATWSPGNLDTVRSVRPFAKLGIDASQDLEGRCLPVYHLSAQKSEPIQNVTMLTF